MTGCWKSGDLCTIINIVHKSVTIHDLLKKCLYQGIYHKISVVRHPVGSVEGIQPLGEPDTKY